MTSAQQQLAQLDDQQAAITQAILAMEEGRWTGPGSVEAWLLALNPSWQGKLSPRTPLYAGDTSPPPIVNTPLEVQWIGSPNYTPGRNGYSVIALVVHTIGGSLAGCDSWFNNPSAMVSAHYGVGLRGQQHQYVNLSNSAWANGILQPGNTWPGPAGNPNYQTVSIETEDLGIATTPVSDPMYNSCLAIGRHVLQQYPGIRWLLGHHCISPQTRPNCCGKRWLDSGRFYQLAADLGLQARY